MAYIKNTTFHKQKKKQNTLFRKIKVILGKKRVIVRGTLMGFSKFNLERLMEHICPMFFFCICYINITNKNILNSRQFYFRLFCTYNKKEISNSSFLCLAFGNFI